MKNKNDIKIAIPSYQRYQLLLDKTLPFLAKHNVPAEQVTIFVANEEELVKYEDALKGNYYSNIVLGVPTIGAQRNFITNYYNDGDWVVMSDDDIADLVQKTGEQTAEPVEDLLETLEGFFKQTEDEGAQTWGIYPVDNPYFMKYRVNTKLTYIIACFTGIIVDKDPELKRYLNHGEDQLFSILSFKKYGKVCRFEEYTVKTKFFGEGGLQEFRSQENVVEESIKRIANDHPEYAKAYLKKNGVWDIKWKQGPTNKNQVSLF